MTPPDPTKGKGDNPANRKMAEEIYDQIMGKIEPDLLLKNIPTLDEKYAGETPEEHEARMKRYEVAYTQFDKEIQEFMSKVNEKAKEAKKASRKKKEAQSREQEQTQLESLEQAFE